MSPKRLFIGLSLGSNTKNYLSNIQRSIENDIVKARWTDETNLHITLKYLGETNKYHEVIHALDKCLHTHTPFKLTLDKLDVFKRGTKHIVWVGSSKPNQTLQALVNTVEEAMASLGFKKEERPFTLHVTLARDAILKQAITHNDEHEIQVEAVTLFESHRVNGRLTYTPHHQVLLGENER